MDWNPPFRSVFVAKGLKLEASLITGDDLNTKLLLPLVKSATK